jgi:hypothetical protein
VEEAIMTQPASPDHDPVEVLRRWESAGGDWRVLARGPHGITVSLRRCDGGEEVDRIQSSDPRLAAYVYGHQPAD